MRIKYFTATRQMPILCFWRRCDGRWLSQIFFWIQTPPENHSDSNQICFYSKLGKVFPLAEFQAKLFLTRNWVGGFYRDSLLRILFLYLLNLKTVQKSRRCDRDVKTRELPSWTKRDLDLTTSALAPEVRSRLLRASSRRHLRSRCLC